MAAHLLQQPHATGKPIAVSREEARTLLGFRRSAYAPVMKEIALKVLDAQIEQNETEPATEANRHRVLAAREIISTLFDGAIADEKA